VSKKHYEGWQEYADAKPGDKVEVVSADYVSLEDKLKAERDRLASELEQAKLAKCVAIEQLDGATRAIASFNDKALIKFLYAGPEYLELEAKLAQVTKERDGFELRRDELIELRADALVQRDAYYKELKRVTKERDEFQRMKHELFEEWKEGDDSGCSSWGHTETCKQIDLGQAKKAMRLTIESQAAQLATFRKALIAISQDYYTKYGNLNDWPIVAIKECVDTDTRIAKKALETPPSVYEQKLKKLVEAVKELRIYCLGNDSSTMNMIERFDTALKEWKSF
jgi:hypothetical protein